MSNFGNGTIAAFDPLTQLESAGLFGHLAAVPEPSSHALLLLGLGAVVALSRRRLRPQV